MTPFQRWLLINSAALSLLLFGLHGTTWAWYLWLILTGLLGVLAPLAFLVLRYLPGTKPLTPGVPALTDLAYDLLVLLLLTWFDHWPAAALWLWCLLWSQALFALCAVHRS